MNRSTSTTTPVSPPPPASKSKEGGDDDQDEVTFVSETLGTPNKLTSVYPEIPSPAADKGGHSTQGSPSGRKERQRQLDSPLNEVSKKVEKKEEKQQDTGILADVAKKRGKKRARTLTKSGEEDEGEITATKLEDVRCGSGSGSGSGSPSKNVEKTIEVRFLVHKLTGRSHASVSTRCAIEEQPQGYAWG
ncbi:uncharacterized protein UHOD_02371 [Ustilago sp. UG-2017b]|nr:uncharacterized protein UHOD_02371 [Ustilago sp. UG-2017b]